MTWSPTNPPLRGGSYSRFIAKRQATLPASTRGVLAVPFTHDWGPVETFVDLDNLAEFIGVYGQGGDPTSGVYTPGFIAIYNAFKGAGASDPGAARVVAFRMAGSAAAKATVTISNTAGSPVPALRLRGVYEGTKGNTISYSIEANAGDPTNLHDLVVYLGNTEVERFSYAKTNLQSLADKINATNGTGSGWLDADGPSGGAVITGTALAITAKTALTGGNDGSTLVAQDWTDMRTAYEAKRFEVMAPFDLTDTTITTALSAWAALKNDPVGPTRSKRLMLVTGGLPAEVLATATARATAANNPNVVTVGVGTYRDTVLGISMSTAQLAPRIAGIIARRGFTSSIFCTHLDDLEVVVGPSDSDILSALGNGVVTLSLDTLGVRIEGSNTTYTSDTTDRPKAIYGVIKYVFTMESFERDVQEQQEAGDVIGRLNVNDDTRETLIGNSQALLDDVYIAQGAVQAGARVVLSQDPPPSDDQNFVGLDWLPRFQRTLDQVRNTFYVS